MPFIHIQDKTLRVGGVFVIGRGKSCNLAIGHPSLSRQHARIAPDGEAWTIEDLGSANGTLVDGQRLDAGPHRLADGAKIQVGDAALRFALVDSGRLEDLDGSLDLPAPEPGIRDPNTLVGSSFCGHHVVSLIRQEVAGPLLMARRDGQPRDIHLWVLDPEIERHELPEFFQHFCDLLALAAGLRHPELTRVLQCGKTDGLIWYTTEQPAGLTLAQRIHAGFSPLEAVRTILGLCRLLHVYHEAGLVHGDIKPALVHVDEQGKVRLGSFGLAGLGSVNRRRLQEAGATRQVYYLDPEQARSGDCNVQSDGYSVGCILVQLLTGRPPFIGANFQEVQEAHRSQPVPMLAEALGLPRVLDTVIDGLLAKSTFSRYDNLAPAMADLSTLEAMLG